MADGEQTQPDPIDQKIDQKLDVVAQRISQQLGAGLQQTAQYLEQRLASPQQPSQPASLPDEKKRDLARFLLTHPDDAIRSIIDTSRQQAVAEARQELDRRQQEQAQQSQWEQFWAAKRQQHSDVPDFYLDNVNGYFQRSSDPDVNKRIDDAYAYARTLRAQDIAAAQQQKQAQDAQARMVSGAGPGGAGGAPPWMPSQRADDPDAGKSYGDLQADAVREMQQRHAGKLQRNW